MTDHFLTPFKVTKKDMDAINLLTRREIKPEEIYTFSVILCGNDVDRDGEAFTKDALFKMSKLFKGKTGILDHQMSSKNQVARIYKTSIIKTDKKTKYGDDKYLLKAWAYMVRTNDTKDLILKIDAGIIKEVSVSCQVKTRICSICDNLYDGSCNHILGKHYDNKFCFVKLCDPNDAYEWSFVAVPAQVEAGVVKHYKMSDQTGECSKQTLSLMHYENKLKSQIVKLSFLTNFMKDNESFKDILNKLTIKELEDFKDEFSKKVDDENFKATTTLKESFKSIETQPFIV